MTHSLRFKSLIITHTVFGAIQANVYVQALQPHLRFHPSAVVVAMEATQDKGRVTITINLARGTSWT